MALPKLQNPGDEDFGSNRKDCIKVYYEDLSVCTSYACLHQLHLFARMNTGNVANLEPHNLLIRFGMTYTMCTLHHFVARFNFVHLHFSNYWHSGPLRRQLLTLWTIRPPDRQLLTLRTNQTSTTDTLDKFLALQ